MFKEVGAPDINIADLRWKLKAMITESFEDFQLHFKETCNSIEAFIDLAKDFKVGPREDLLKRRFKKTLKEYKSYSEKLIKTEFEDERKTLFVKLYAEELMNLFLDLEDYGYEIS